MQRVFECTTISKLFSKTILRLRFGCIGLLVCILKVRSNVEHSIHYKSNRRTIPNFPKNGSSIHLSARKVLFKSMFAKLERYFFQKENRKEGIDILRCFEVSKTCVRSENLFARCFLLVPRFLFLQSVNAWKVCAWILRNNF